MYWWLMAAHSLLMAADQSKKRFKNECCEKEKLTMGLTQLRRVVTGHNEAGRAVVTDDAILTGKPIPTGESILLWSSVGIPVDNDDTVDGRDRPVGLTLHGGTVLRVIDLLPGKRSALHRTNSIDFGIVMSGVIELELDDGAITSLEAGSIVVQRGTIHAWRNPSKDTIARIAFVLIDALPATFDGRPLPAILPGSAHAK
jgi:quercetin dioxygenase-like cupin family protein